NEAYTVLSDPEKRKLYDTYGSTGGVPQYGQGSPFGGSTGGVYTNVSPEEFAGFSDFFQSMFGGFAGGATGGRSPTGDPFAAYGRSTGRPAPRPATAEARLDVGLLDAYRGGPTTIRVEGNQLE